MRSFVIVWMIGTAALAADTPKSNVTFNKDVLPILEKNCHSTCPKSMIETTKMYNPNMKVDILAIPPRKDPGDVCCKWRFSVRTEYHPEYVPVSSGSPALHIALLDLT